MLLDMSVRKESVCVCVCVCVREEAALLRQDVCVWEQEALCVPRLSSRCCKSLDYTTETLRTHRCPVTEDEIKPHNLFSAKNLKTKQIVPSNWKSIQLQEETVTANTNGRHRNVKKVVKMMPGLFFSMI